MSATVKTANARKPVSAHHGGRPPDSTEAGLRTARKQASGQHGSLPPYITEAGLPASREMAGVSAHPELRFAYTGLSAFHAFGVSATILNTPDEKANNLFLI